MSFARPEMLLLLWSLPLAALLLWLESRRRFRALSRFASKEALAHISPDRTRARRMVKAGLFLVGTAALCLALAGPQYGYQWKKIEQKGVDLMVALDCSKSMLARDIKPNRLARAKREIVDLVDMLEGDRVGLVAFAGTAFLQCPLTLDYGALDLFLDAMGPERMPIGGTNLARALNTSLDAFDPDSDTDKGVILITDGEATTGDWREAAERARDMGVKVFCVGVGAPGGAPVPDGGGYARDDRGNVKVALLDEAALTEIASLTGGEYVRSVAGDMDLERIYFQDIRGTMEVSTLKAEREKVMEDRFQWLLALALTAFFAEMVVAPVGRRRAAALLLALALLAPASVVHARDEGVAAYDAKEYEKALSSLLQGQIERPDDPAMFYNLGNVYYRMGEFEKARQNYSEALERGGADLRRHAFYNMGNAAFRMEDFADAVALYEKALELDPADEEAASNLEIARRMLEEQKRRQQQEQESGQGGQRKDQKGQGQDQKGRNQQGESPKDQDGQKKGDTGSQQKQKEKGWQPGGSDQNQMQDEGQSERGDSGSEDHGGQTDGDQKQDQGRDGQGRKEASDQAPEGRQEDSGPSAQGEKAEAPGQKGEDSGEPGRAQHESKGSQDVSGRLDARGGEEENQGQQAGQKSAQTSPGKAEEAGEKAEGVTLDVSGGVLNRLKDKPGEAMVPAYGERRVNEDW